MAGSCYVNYFVRSVKTGLGRLTLVVAVISIDAYAFPTAISGDVNISEVPGCHLL